jgi:hypothetical protein
MLSIRPRYAAGEVLLVAAWLDGNDQPLVDMVAPEADDFYTRHAHKPASAYRFVSN